MSKGTASKMKTNLFREFAGAVLRSLPDDLDVAVVQGWIENQESLRRVLRVALEPLIKTSALTYDKTKNGWKLIENAVQSTPIDIKKFVLVFSPRGGENYINGEEMLRCSIEMKCNFGQDVAEYFFAHQDQIPAEFRNYYLVFPGTVWRDMDELRLVPYLGWDGDQWRLDFGWPGLNLFDNYRLLRPRKTA